MGAFERFLAAGLAALALTGSGTPAPATAAELPPAISCRGCWQPAPGASWQLQLQGPVDISVRASVYEIDGLDASAALVARLHRRGRHAICYLNAGAWERWRRDSAAFPEVVP